MSGTITQIVDSLQNNRDSSEEFGGGGVNEAMIDWFALLSHFFTMAKIAKGGGNNLKWFLWWFFIVENTRNKRTRFLDLQRFVSWFLSFPFSVKEWNFGYGNGRKKKEKKRDND